MIKTDPLFATRKTLDEICTAPEKIISVYSLEKHVWADSNSVAARRARRPELKTVEEFLIDPVRSFLNDILRNMAASLIKPDRMAERQENPAGQGYWIQAEFGSGKSHLLCFLSALALGDEAAWEIVKQKEKKAGRSKHDTLHLFWEKGLKAQSRKGKGVFVVVITLTGTGGGAVGLHDKGRRLTEYILDAAKAQIEIELGKNISLYPSELLTDRFLTRDFDRYHHDLKNFLKDPRFFEEDEIEDIDTFIRRIRQEQSPAHKQSCGAELWCFYTEYLKVQPQIEAETEDILKHFVLTVLDEGYSGVLLVLDEVSQFMKNRDGHQRVDDEDTLNVLSNRLAQIHNLPVWTVCAAQNAPQSKTGVKNIIADDRLKLVKLPENDQDRYDIALSRVREIKDPEAVKKYYLLYKRGFNWPDSIGQAEFTRFFPFHKPALEVLTAITLELSTARSAISFMHLTLQHQIKNKGDHIIRLWELFDEAVFHKEDPGSVNTGLTAIKVKRETDFRAYLACKRQIENISKGYLKVYRNKAIRIIRTLFLYFVAKTRQQGISPQEIADNLLLEREPDSNIEENIQHYETLAENLKRELRQIVLNPDENGQPRFRFDPVFTGVDPRDEFKKAQAAAQANPLMLQDAWEHLLAADKWMVRMRHTNMDLSGGIRSIFRTVAAPNGPAYATLPIVWQGRQTGGRIGMRNLGKIADDNLPLPPICSDETDLDFQVIIGKLPIESESIKKILTQYRDPRLILWVPDKLTPEEHARLIDFAAFRKLVKDWQGQGSEDALAVVNWVADVLQTDMAQIYQIVTGSYRRGRMDAQEHSNISFNVTGELKAILTPAVGQVLSSCYISQDIRFDPPFEFRKEDGVKVINGIVKTGEILKEAKFKAKIRDINAARNFGFGLKIMQKSAGHLLDTSDNPYIQAMWMFINDNITDDRPSMKVETLYKNFMGMGGSKAYGLTRRMVEIYLLGLVKNGKIRILVTPKAGISGNMLDYTNIASVDFSVKVLNAMLDVQKMAELEKKMGNITVINVNLSDFKPSRNFIQKKHIDALADEFRQFLEQSFNEIQDDDGVPTVIHITNQE
ncbi:hypothetical protein QUF90_13435 [Desulfococcaceae bacterium HSG9]|nr:hypothetical protein [Desulfococcaceae bacterium HSG9]